MSAAAETLPAMPLPTTPASVPLKPPVASAPLQPPSTLPTSLQSPTALALMQPTTSFALLPSTTVPELPQVPATPVLVQTPIAPEPLLPQTAPELLPLQNASELPQPPISTEVLQPSTAPAPLPSPAPEQPAPLNEQEMLTQPPTTPILLPSPSTSKQLTSQSAPEQAPTTTTVQRPPAATTSPKPSSSSAKSSSAKHTVHWFRKGLRLHDNPSLREGLKGASTFRCIFIIDPWFASSSNVGINKWRFLLQCLQNLDNSLKKLNSRLFVIRGQPAEALPKLFREWSTTSFTFEEDPEPFGRVRDRNITSKCREVGIDVISRVSHTLYELDNIIELNGGKAPLTYHKFQALIAGMPSPAPPEPTVTLEWLQKHGITSPVTDDHEDRFSVPSLEELGFDVEGLKDPVWIGGESEALTRLDRHLERKAWVASFGRPKMTTQSLLASKTGLSPYLRFGCLSTRLFYYQLTELYERVKGVRPPLSLHGQLLWREFFYCAATRNPHFDRMEGNPICVQIPWEENQDALAKWANGQTGYPWIDAIMIQLRQEGWIHHLARHAVACFLTRGDLWISWEEGMKVFDELLLDADWSVNAGMWMWLSCSSFFQQFFHCYSPVRFGRKIDPNGDYIRKYVPVLKNMPTRFVHEPWEAPEAVQRSARCIIGQDYPLPMVDHEKASLINIERIKQVYAQLAKFKPQGALNPQPVQRPNETQSSPSPTSIITSINQSNYLCSPLPGPTTSTVQKIPYKDDDLFQRPLNVYPRRSQFKQVVIVQRTQKSVSTVNTQRRSSRRDNLQSQEKQESYDFKNLAINNVQKSNNREMYHRSKVNRTEIYTQETIKDDNCCFIKPKHYLYHRESGVRVVKVRSQSGARPNFNNETTHNTMRHNRHNKSATTINDRPDEGTGVHPMPVNSESYTGEPQHNDPSTSCRYPTSNDNQG